MFGTESLLGGYFPVASDLEDNLDSKTPDEKSFWDKSRSNGCLVIFILCSLTCLAVGFASGTILSRWVASGDSTGPEAVSACKTPQFRREWRSLSHRGKHNYIEAVKCLKQTPSRLGLNQSLYDDFPYVHFRVGGYSHGAAAFLAWHRYFLHIYHRALQEECHFTGELTYWNWALDWQNMTASPIWDLDTGFGGNGDPNIGVSVVEGHCVTNGPFSHITIPYLDAEFAPHCLSRGFEQGRELTEHGTWFNPAALEALLRLNEYEAFNLGLEDGPHIAIPRSIRGDFSLLTAPSDPVFFLHHAQLDRLWWIWQGMDYGMRGRMYKGKTRHNSTEVASLDDVVPMGGLAKDVRVRDIIGTEDGLLCYRY